MKIAPIDFLVPSLFAVMAMMTGIMWLSVGSPFPLEPRVPGLDGAPSLAGDGTGATSAEATPEPGEPIPGDGVPSAVSGTWPGFRGAARNGIAEGSVPLARQWPDGGPPELWRIELGEGYASAAVDQGRVYVLDYDEANQADTLRCLSLDDGREVWRNGYPVLVTRNHGISRTTPLVVGDCVITLGPRLHVACWEAATGRCRWFLDLVREYGATVPRWYAGQCPLLDQDRLILAPCGDAMLIAVDYETGEVLWESENPRGWEMTHVSVTPMDFQGQRTYVYCGSGGVAGIAADSGQLLWDSIEWPVQFAHAPSPLVLPGDRVFLCSGYDSKTGSLLLQLTTQGEQVVAEVAARLTPKQFNSEQQTPILHENHIFGVRKRGGGQLVCLDLAGQEVWNSGSDRFGHGPYMIADGLILVMDNGGRLTLAEATTEGYRHLASHEVFVDGHDAWGPMALAAGRLLVRDLTRMACLDIAAD
jgi:outer membrane protein assembly factor BamB